MPSGLAHGLFASTDAYAIPNHLLFRRRDVHQPRLVGEFAVEVGGTGKTAPRFDAKERRAAGL
jgi:hypothetical protein